MDNLKWDPNEDWLLVSCINTKNGEYIILDYDFNHISNTNCDSNFDQ